MVFRCLVSALAMASQAALLGICVSLSHKFDVSDFAARSTTV